MTRPARRRRWLAVLAILLSACASTPNLKTEQGRVAYTAQQVVVRVNDVQNAAIDAESRATIPTEVARQIIATCVSMNETLRATPRGWEQTVRTAWSELKFHLGPITNQALVTAMAIVDAMLEALL